MKKFKQFLAITMVLSMVISTNAFATPINLTDTPADASKTDTLDKANGTDYFADEDTNNWQGGSITEEVRVNVDCASYFTITIPKEIVLNGNDGSATYEVSITGELAGDQALVVKPDATFTLTEDGGKTTPVTVTQDKDTFNYQDINDSVKGNGTLSASKISAGNWSGKFNFNIEFKAKNCEHSYVGTLTKEATETENGEMTYACLKCGKVDRVESVAPSFATMSWAAISNISEAGNASSIFSIGDEKEITIGEYTYIDEGYDPIKCESGLITREHPKTTYHVQILGFNHDDKSDGTGKASITVGLKEIMITSKAINSTSTNIGGWENSEMRTYLNETVYNNLPQTIKDIIKPVDKKTSGGNTSREIKTTSDKLFLLSEIEIFGSTTFSPSGEGSQYEYFANGGSTIKYKNGSTVCWWERSPYGGNVYAFCNVYYDGNVYYRPATNSYGVVFGFSI